MFCAVVLRDSQCLSFTLAGPCIRVFCVSLRFIPFNPPKSSSLIIRNWCPNYIAGNTPPLYSRNERRLEYVNRKTIEPRNYCSTLDRERGAERRRVKSAQTGFSQTTAKKRRKKGVGLKAKSKAGLCESGASLSSDPRFVSLRFRVTRSIIRDIRSQLAPFSKWKSRDSVFGLTPFLSSWQSFARETRPSRIKPTPSAPRSIKSGTIVPGIDCFPIYTLVFASSRKHRNKFHHFHWLLPLLLNRHSSFCRESP